jgi:valyl-tRNA synthetase
MEKYEMGIALANLYDFVWNDFCDWYIELTKPILYGEDDKKRNDTVSVLVHVLDKILKLLHPFVPFITEKIYKDMPISEKTIMLSEFPRYNSRLNYKSAFAEIEQVKEIIKAIRNVKSQSGAVPSKKVKLYVVCENPKSIKNGSVYIEKLAGVNGIEFISDKSALTEKTVSQIVSGVELYITLGELVDLSKELERLKKELDTVESEIKRASGKLANKGFLDKAPKALVDAERAKLDDFIDVRKKLNQQILELQK